MTHTVTFNAELNIVETKVQGDLWPAEAKALTSEIAQAVIQHNCCLCLSDYRQAVLRLSTLDLYEIPKSITKLLKAADIPANKLRRALVVSNKAEDFHFFETVSLNDGQLAKVFQDRDQALSWLYESI